MYPVHPHRRSRWGSGRPAALALAALTAAALTGCTAPSGPAPDDGTAPRPELQRFYGQRLAWKACGDLRCARLTVPRDYGRPDDGKTFVLPVVKAPTADPDRRIGSLVYNPGGPGASGVSDLKADGGEAFTAKLRARFDIVSFDPRGVGGSVPAVSCAETDEEETDEDDTSEEETGEDGTGGGEAPEPLTPRTPAERARAVAEADGQAAACVRGSRAVLPHVGTADAARDLDVLRAALGDRGLTYLGWSYGTSLGTSYAEQFPHRVRALALDGAMDPALDWRQRALSQGTGFRRAVDDYAEYCADIAGDDCPGSTPAEISALLDGLYERAARAPLPVTDEELYEVDARTLLDVVTAAMYSPEDDWQELSRALAAADDGDGTKLARMAGSDAPATESRRTHRPRAAAENDDEAIVAVSCLDVPHPRTAAPYWKALEAAEKAAGSYGTTSVTDELTCKDWPTGAGAGHPHWVRADGVPPVLVIGTTGDPATPYEEAESLAGQFPGGMLLTYDDIGHTAYGRGGHCVSDAVDAYLIRRERIRPGATC